MSDLKSEIRELLIELRELSKTVTDNWVEEYETVFDGEDFNLITEDMVLNAYAKKYDVRVFPANFRQLIQACCEELGMEREEYFMLDAPPGAKFYRIHLR